MDKGCNDQKDTKETENQPAFKAAQELGKKLALLVEVLGSTRNQRFVDLPEMTSPSARRKAVRDRLQGCL